MKGIEEWLKPWVWRIVIWLWFAICWRPLKVVAGSRTGDVPATSQAERR